MDQILDIKNICRSCMLNNSILLSIFQLSAENDKIKISEMLTSCTSIQVSLCDGLPENICKKCAEELKIAYNFKKRCEENDSYLREYIYAVSRKEEPVKKNGETDQEDRKNLDSHCNISKNDVEEFITREFNQTDEEFTDAEFGENVSEEEKSKHICKLCKKTFTQSSSLVVHMKRHNGQKEHKCHLCPKAFTTGGSLTIHLRSHTGERPYECPQCKKRFVTSDSLQKHQRRHNGERPHLCSVCGKGFAAAGTLQVHMRVHSGDKPLRCQICDMRFAAHAGLSVHIRKHTGERPYLCSHCGKGFKSSSDLTSHTRRHTGERPFQCDVCDKKFRTSYMRSVHRRTHTGERPAKCSICQKSFTSNGHLSIHLRSHLEVKPHSCIICNRSFTLAKDLTLHMMVHTGQRPYVCPQCGKGFNRPNNLAKHIRLHSGIKPFTCQVCKYTFSTSTELKIHVRSHTGERPYPCTACEKKFASSSGLARHKRRQHSPTQISDPPILASNSDFSHKIPPTNSVLKTNTLYTCPPPCPDLAPLSNPAEKTQRVRPLPENKIGNDIGSEAFISPDLSRLSETAKNLQHSSLVTAKRNTTKLIPKRIPAHSNQDGSVVENSAQNKVRVFQSVSNLKNGGLNYCDLVVPVSESQMLEVHPQAVGPVFVVNQPQNFEDVVFK